MAPQYTLEYVTYDLAVLDNATDYPVPHRLLPKELFDPDNTTEARRFALRKYAPYRLPDLTIGSWMRLAKRLGNGKHKKLWKRFKAFMYMKK
jgi:endopolyphosphatase